MKILARISELDIIEYPYPITDLTFMLIGKNIINKPKAMRYNDLETGDIVFYEED